MGFKFQTGFRRLIRHFQETDFIEKFRQYIHKITTLGVFLPVREEYKTYDGQSQSLVELGSQ